MSHLGSRRSDITHCIILEVRMKTWILGLVLVSSAMAADSLPYDLKKAKVTGCLADTRYYAGISDSEKKGCPEAIENILYALRYNYGIGERPEEDGCELERTQMLFLIWDEKKVELQKNQKGEMRAHLACFPEGQESYLWYIDYDPKTKKVISVQKAGL